MENIDELLRISEDANDLVQKGKGLVTEEFLQEFENQYHNLKDKAKEIMNPDRNLRIGIVGQVKAGKSSFLNALLFDGQEVLPKAATPMTAGLTKIVYAEQEYAKVTYYTEADWHGIESGSKSYDKEFEAGCERKKKEKAVREERREQQEQKRLQRMKEQIIDRATQMRRSIKLSDAEIKDVEAHIPAKLCACKELTDLCQKEGEDELLEKLGTEETISFTDLAEYIGANGRYASVVKSIEVGVRMPDVQDLEVIDTPGLGDPIISRGERTRQFLMSCDLVILLSTASQFMKESDVSLIAETLPRNSIQQVCFVASRFDEAMLEDPERGRTDLVKVYSRTSKKLGQTLRERLQDYGSKVSNPLFQNLLRQLKDRDCLNCTASLLFIAARKKEQGLPWSEEETHVIHQMLDRFDRMSDDTDTLKELAGIERFKKKEFLPIHKQKNALIHKRQTEFVADQRQELMARVEEIRYETESNLRQLKDEDIASVEVKIQQTEDAIYHMRKRLSNQFDECSIEASRRLLALSNDIRKLVKRYNDFDVVEKTDTIRQRETHWFSPNEVWLEHQTHHTASVASVIQNIDAYIDDAFDLIQANMEKAVDIDGMKRKVREIVLHGFVDGETDFAAEDIERVIGILLQRMSLPAFQIVDKQPYRDIIIQRFSDAVVMDEDIHRMETAMEQVLDQIKEDIVRKLQEKDIEVHKFMREQSMTFAYDVAKQIIGKMELLKANLQDKQANVRRFETFLQHMAVCKESYRTLPQEGTK